MELFIKGNIPFETSTDHNLFDRHNIFMLAIQQQSNLADGAQRKSILLTLHTHLFQGDNFGIASISCSVWNGMEN